MSWIQFFPFKSYEFVCSICSKILKRTFLYFIFKTFKYKMKRRDSKEIKTTKDLVNKKIEKCFYLVVAEFN